VVRGERVLGVELVGGVAVRMGEAGFAGDGVKPGVGGGRMGEQTEAEHECTQNSGREGPE
jgi:hypothetical protein